MAGAKTTDKEVTQEIPPNEAGREVLSYVQKEEAEADAIFNEANGIGDPEDKETDDDKTGDKEAEEEAASQEPEKTDDKEAKDKDPEGKDKVADTDDDLTKGLSTDNATKRISAAQNKMHDSNARAKTAEEQRDKLQAERDDLLKKLETKPAEAAAEPGKEAAAKEAPKDDELTVAMEELNQEYPEIAKPMLKMMARQEVENKRLTEKVDNLEKAEETRTATAVTEKKNDHVTAIKDAHADYKEISEEPLLDEWIEGLPAMERAGARAIRKDGSTADVIELLTTFKKANGYELPAASKEDTPGKKSNSKLDKARKASTPSFHKSKDVNLKDGQGAPFTRQQIDAMSMTEYAKNEPAIDEAMSKGFPPQ